MRTTQNAVLGALQGAQRFLDTNDAVLTSTVDFTAARKRLDAVIASFTTHAFDQDASNRSAKGETEKQRQMRLTMRAEQMAPIAEIARRDLRNVPEFGALQLPPRYAKGGAFIASADAMAAAAANNKAALLERGMPADFLDQFQASLAQFKASVTDREEIRSHRMGATKGIAVQEQNGRSVLKVLDALVRRALRGNDALLQTWKGARAIPRQRRTPTQTTTTPSTPTVTPATTATNTAVPEVTTKA